MELICGFQYISREYVGSYVHYCFINKLTKIAKPQKRFHGLLGHRRREMSFLETASDEEDCDLPKLKQYTVMIGLLQHTSLFLLQKD